MKQRDFRDYLQDILDAINNVEEFVGNMSFEQFIKDKKTLDAVVRNIEIIGEASKNVPEPIRAKYKELPWKKMMGMRDKLIHGYFGMDYETIWKAAKEDVPSLRKEVRRMLKDQEMR